MASSCLEAAKNMTTQEFSKKAFECFELHEKLYLGLEEYRMKLGALESYADKPETKAMLSIAHHFILNGLSNALYAQREALIRAIGMEKEKQ